MRRRISTGEIGPNLVEVTQLHDGCCAIIREYYSASFAVPQGRDMTTGNALVQKVCMLFDKIIQT